MKQWWLNLAERERRILLLGTAAVLFALLYWGGWAPLQQNLQQRRHQVQQLQQQLNWMHQQAPLLRQLKQTSTDQCCRKYRHCQCPNREQPDPTAGIKTYSATGRKRAG
jgi:Type II secretory pathway, component PulM